MARKNPSFDRRRRLWLTAGAIGGASVLAAGAIAVSPWRPAWAQLFNPCHATLPPHLAGHPLVQQAWAGVNPALVWDVHVHLAGTGDSGSGIFFSDEMSSLLHPLQFAQRLFYLNAGCVHDAPGRVDASFVERLHNLLAGLPPGVKLLLYAFDMTYDESGQLLRERTAFHVPNAYARDVARRHPAGFEWVCSIHPYRPDAVPALLQAAAEGARAVKWLPTAMNIDPASPRCDPFYAALAASGLPLITHAGEEKAVHGANQQHYGNPLRLRRALDRGVRVVVAHCASLGQDVDLDRGPAGPRVPSFDLFARLMDDARYGPHLAGDISAITQRNRDLRVVRTLLARRDWHGRLLNGSDYPLPGVMPLFSPQELAAAGLLDPAAAGVINELQGYNPLLFDFVLKRHLRLDGAGLSPSVFETRPFFRA